MLYRLTRITAGTIVATVAAIASYLHMVRVALETGETPLVAYLMPLSVDGLMIYATLTMGRDRRQGSRVAIRTWVAFMAGLSASLAANILAAGPTIVARCVAAWPAIALLFVVEMIARTPPAPAPVAVHTPVDVLEPVADLEPEDTPEAARKSAREHVAAYRALLAAVPDITQTAAAAHLGISARRLGSILSQNPG